MDFHHNTHPSKTFASDKFDEAVDRLREAYDIKIEELTEREVATAIKQSLLAGDFQKLISHNHKSFGIVYIPYLECGKLKNRIKKLEALLEENNIELPV